MSLGKHKFCQFVPASIQISFDKYICLKNIWSSRVPTRWLNKKLPKKVPEYFVGLLLYEICVNRPNFLNVSQKSSKFYGKFFIFAL